MNENKGDGANEDAIVSVKRSAQVDWQDLPDVFRPLNEFTDKATNGGAIGPVDLPDVVRPQSQNPKIPVKTGKRVEYI